ncbi:MAG: helical backbone metal receptor [Myxococcota bacterium]|nr:helical backbone metal receptor [Myxococcota bacterium]
MSACPNPDARRIVSLVPSLTESLFVLGLGDRVVGVTDWCVHPAEAVAPLSKVGGTKNPDLDALLGLEPDLVIANHEENRRRDVERLQAAGIPVWVTYPRTVSEGARLLAEVADLGASPEVRESVVESTQRAVRDAASVRPLTPTAVFCPIWRDPWMTVGPDTYAHDLLTLCGGRNVFGEGREGERRYPRIQLGDIQAARPEVILLPDEPYDFGPRDAAELARLDVPAAAQGRIHLIDGTLLSWYGPRIQRAIETLRRLLRRDPHPGRSSEGSTESGGAVQETSQDES